MFILPDVRSTTLQRDRSRWRVPEYETFHGQWRVASRGVSSVLHRRFEPTQSSAANKASEHVWRGFKSARTNRSPRRPKWGRAARRAVVARGTSKGGEFPLSHSWLTRYRRCVGLDRSRDPSEVADCRSISGPVNKTTPPPPPGSMVNGILGHPEIEAACER